VAAKNDEGAAGKKSAAPGNTGAIVAALVKTNPRRQAHAAAKALIAEAGHLQPGQLTSFLAGAIVQRWKQNLRPNTARTYRAELKALLRALETFGAPSITLTKIPWRQRAVVASGEELAKLLKQPPAWLRLYMLLYFQCGLRHSETLRVTARSWNRENHTVTVVVKGGRERTVLVSQDVEALLTSAGDPDPDTPLLWVLRGHRISGHSLSNAFIRHKYQ
jgi:integrase